ncbi:Cof-type HAD-IIB family hydrolase [Bacillus canaveralius]|uniref:Cof-type HAD-IIB family hydrolase n=1 Tax=Bacillus canaveralius TaxID=1403243 RepID=A0A2N5GSG3_9BACI|nr:Cof-type HAD-IIB family hydrolase [Bacillus canaveralius]PLR86581.1 Cof-type HAD-IIB family hydrolase [Bacillus canaveralius]PLS00352.1 Cof-type HAD-IIB family hydrolase [Bacillus canaveralius]
MVKLIAVDLDGTLLNEENRVSEKNLESIKYAQSKGIEVVIATGRAHFDVQTIFKDTGVKTWIIGANGATIHQPDRKLLHSVPINKDDAIYILNWLEQEEFYYEVFSNDAIFTPHNGRELMAIEMDRALSANPDINAGVLEDAAKKQFSQTGFSSITSYKDLFESNVDIYNILAFSFDLEKLKRGWAQFESLQDLTLVSSAKHNFELEHTDASKGIALKILASKLNIPLKDTAAVGDSFNDLSMFKIAGRSAAMGNAHQQIKDVCDEVTLTNDEDGVAHFIYSLIRNTESVS